MNIEQYAENVRNCKDAHVIESKEDFIQRYKENLTLLKQHPSSKEIQESLLPSMNTALPFVSSSTSFSNYVFDTFLSIEKKFSKDIILSRDLEKEFSKRLSGRLDQVINTLYHNAGILARNILEHAEIIGNGNTIEKSLQRFHSNYSKRNLTCQDIDWLNSFTKLKINMRLGKGDYSFHTNEAYKDATSIFSSEINMYKLYNKKTKNIK